ncbi:MAG: 4Fe-4S binding protein [Christensenellaceae bacterium]|nr:4Fe-4S binding protein [Christensenellaceae bacterium]
MPMGVTLGMGRRRGLSWLRRIILEQVMRVKSESLSKEKKILKVILWVYIGLCVLIAGLNYGYAPRADAKTAQFLTWFWHFYENWVKTAFILIASLLTIRITSRSGRTSLRRKNLIGFLAAALVVHVALPLVSGNYEWYFFTMPLPWTTTPLQLFDTGSAFRLSRFPVWGAAGVAGVLVFYAVVTVLIFAGTVLFGRRLQCSMLCLFNGFAAEVFDPAIPLMGQRRKPSKAQGIALSIARWGFLAAAFFFTLWWVGSLLGLTSTAARADFAKAETYVYLAGELLMAMFFWVAFMGRGYCYYCPLGTVLSGLARLGGQRIDTTRTQCVRCGRCTEVCPMDIDIKAAAEDAVPLQHSRCVGCGRCVDACPTQTLRYTTRFIDKIRRN